MKTPDHLQKAREAHHAALERLTGKPGLAEDVFEEWQTKHNAAEFFCALAEKLGVTEDQAKALWAAVDMPPDERERREQEGAAGGEEEAERMAAAGA